MHMSERIELRHLRYFVAVAEELHFGRAARRLGMAQPPLSQQIQRLEKLLDTQLLVRRPRVQLTAAGETLLGSARASLAQLEHSWQDVQRVARGEQGTLVVSFDMSTLLGPLPRLIQRYRRLYPGVRLRLRELATSEQLRALENGSAELGLLREPPPDVGLGYVAVTRERFVAILPANHALARRAAVEVRALAEQPFVHFPRELAPRLHDQIGALCRAAGFQPRVTQEASEWLTIVGLVEAGLGVSIVPESFRQLRWGKAQYRPLRPGTALTRIVLGHSARPLSVPAQRFVELARRLAAGS
jgi:DNA-binding transcriptional LysR family regulator